MAGLAGIRAISSEQPNGAIATGAHEDRAVRSETRPDPHDPETLNVAVAAHDLEAGGGKPQIGEIGIFEAHVGFIDLAVIARNDVAQFIDIDVGQCLGNWPWFSTARFALLV
jgi:hypothetical protein